jgi:two-component system nitrogen regulation response regulator GlnG
MHKPKPQTLLIVDKEADFVAWAQHQVESTGVKVLVASTADQAYRIFCEQEPDLVLTEMNLAPYSGQELLLRIRKHSPNAMVVVTSAFGTTQAVIESMRLGAFDFVRKEQLPFNLKVVVETALKARAELLAASAPKPQLTVEQHQDEIVGQSDAMQQVFKMVGRVAASEAPVMITGESGSGKELVARAIHHYSQRSHKTFLAINCAAIPENLLESELFGHEKGSFTGAHTMRVGRFEQCDGGTLFLDEIGEMPLPVQSKLLRVLQQGEFSRVGGNQTISTDVRIVAATNKTLEQEVLAKNFREDLFYRLNVVRIHLPPLRQRVEDVKLLAEYFLQRIASKKLRPLLQLSEEAIRVLEAYPWPGNVRELENTMERASVLATTDVLLPKDIPLGIPPEQLGTERAGSSQSPLSSLLAGLDATQPLLPQVEKLVIEQVLEDCDGDETAAARRLGLTRAALKKRRGL